MLTRLKLQAYNNGQILVWPFKEYFFPFMLAIEFFDYDESQLEKIECAMLYMGKIYTAEGYLEPIREKQRKRILSYHGWSDQNNQPLVFHTIDDPNFLKTIRLLVRDKTQPRQTENDH